MINMNNEEFERKMAFIVEQQAQFAVDIQKMREVHAETENVVGRLAYVTHVGFKDVNAKIDSLVDSQIRLSEAHARTEGDLNAKVDSLVDSQIRLTESQTRLTESQAQLTESQKQTDERFQRFMEVVDRHFKEDHNNN
jgi:hypothetical protein